LVDVDVSIQVPKGTRGKDLVVEIKKKSLKVGLKGQTPIIEVFKSTESLWMKMMIFHSAILGC